MRRGVARRTKWRGSRRYFSFTQLVLVIVSESDVREFVNRVRVGCVICVCVCVCV